MIDINSFIDECMIMEVILDQRGFPVDGKIKEVNEAFICSFKKENKESYIDFTGKGPYTSYALKICEYVIKSGKTKTFKDYWKNYSLSVDMETIKLSSEECLIMIKNTKRQSEEAFLIEQDQEEVMKEILDNSSDLILSSFSLDTSDDEIKLKFYKCPKDTSFTTENDYDPLDYFVNNLLHPDDKKYFLESFTLQNIITDVNYYNRWEIEIRRKDINNQYRYIKWLIKQAIDSTDKYIGWEYDNSTEHVIQEEIENVQYQFDLYYKILERVGENYYAIYGIDLKNTRMVLLKKNEELSTILYENKIKKTICVKDDLVHDDDLEKVKEFFDVHRLRKAFEYFELEVDSVTFRRIVDWKYQLVKCIARPIYYKDRKIIIFSFENIDSSINEK